MSQLTANQREKLIADLRLVVSDAESLLKLTAEEIGESAIGLRNRLQERLSEAKTNVVDMQASARERAARATRATDEYAHEHPWQSMAVGAVIGVLIGALLTRGLDDLD
ncbi:MAG: DUF883 family protein [Rubrivivax sp.]